MGVIAGLHHARVQGKKIMACEDCDPSLEDELKPPADGESKDKTIRVLIGRQVFANPDQAFWIYQTRLESPVEAWMPSEVTMFAIAGPIGQFSSGDVVKVTGNFVYNSRYGQQFQVIGRGQLAIQESERGFVAWLSKLPQIGEFRALAALKHFGGFQKVLEVLEKNPLRMTEVSGISEERALAIGQAFTEQQGFKELYDFSLRSGLSEAILARTVECWGKTALSRIRANPFDIATVYDEARFPVMDKVRASLALPSTFPPRCLEALFYALSLSTVEGHTYVVKEDLSTLSPSKTGQILRDIGITDEEIEIGLSLAKGSSEQNRAVIEANGRVALANVHRAEVGSAAKLKVMLASETSKDAPKIDEHIWGGLTPSPEQANAIETALRSSVMVLTGGPGVGKTQTVSAIIRQFESMDQKVLLCAPTGKAAQRLSQLCDRPAQTIHRVIAFTENGETDEHINGADVIIVDETSMVDVELFYALIRRVRKTSKLIFVGDEHQLPSIGVGRVLGDLIESTKIPVVRLTQIFRQESDGQTKRIPEVAQSIKEGRLFNTAIKGTDVVFVELDKPDKVAEFVQQAVKTKIPEKYGFDDILVISPQRGELGKKNWDCGVRALNLSLQEALNPKIDIEMPLNEYQVRPGDKVMQVVNDYDLGVFNGEQGRVIRLSPTAFKVHPEVQTSVRRYNQKEKEGAHLQDKGVNCLVQYPDKLVGYQKGEMRNLTLAYAITIHKSQGSQAKAVVIPVDRSHSFMLTRNLLYTALTRAEKYVLLVGQTETLKKAIRTIRGTERRTMLAWYLQDKATRDE